jgi:hypothetical protein
MDFFKRNEIRKQQLNGQWHLEIGDRVQLSSGVQSYPAWSSGTFIALTPAISKLGTKFWLKSVRMDDDGLLEETLEEEPDHRGKVEPKLYLVPHEDYFLSDEDKNA